MQINLKGKTALVCGSSQGIGRAIAIQFAKSGANVILTARNEENLKKVKLSLTQSKYQNHNYFKSDFNKPESMLKPIENLIKEYGNINILINNSGGPSQELLYKEVPNIILEAFTQHLIVSQILVKLLLPGMIATSYGRIININSIGLKQPVENLGTSNIIRAAIGSWAKTLSRELASFGITVNNILPGFTKTERLDKLIKTEVKNSGTSIKQYSKKIQNEIPVGRFGKPDEIAFAACFLASEYASYINGINLPIDGGFLRTL